jgi:hypothetical protein
MTRRLYLRFVVLVIPVLTAMAALPRVRPYDDSAFRAFFMPPGCELPCFMGIRPGETTVAEAITLLQNHQWVRRVNLPPGGSGEVYVTWEWDGTPPPFIHPTFPASFFGRRGGRVTSIVLPVRVTLAEIWWLFQSPPLVEIGEAMERQARFLAFAYPDTGIMISNWLRDCAPPQKSLTHHQWNYLHLYSVDGLARGTNGYRSFAPIPFSALGGRMAC